MARRIIDASEHQKKIDWEKVKASGKIDGVIFRIGYGDNDVGQDDKYFLRNITECERLGIPYEVYLYSYADTNAHIQSEIAHIKRLLAGRNVRVWLDIEYRPAKAFWRKAVEAFLKAFPSGGVYTWEWVFTDILDGIECPRWICAYGPNDGKPHYDYKPHLDCHGWQYTSMASVPGINGNVDMSEWYKDFAEASAKAPAEATTTITAGRSAVVNKMLAWEGYSEQNGKFKALIDGYNDYLPTAVKAGCANYAVKYSDEWCATAASYAYIACGIGYLFPVECSCPRMVTLAKSMGIWQENDGYVPDPADAVLYDWEDSGKGDSTGTPDHIGIVISVDKSKGTFVVMEGNKDEAVGRRTMNINGRYIRGFITPKFVTGTNTGGISAQTAVKKEEVKPAVKTYEVSKTGTPNKTTVIKWGLLKNNQKVTPRLQPDESAKPCSFAPVKPLTRIEVYDYITTAKRWAYCKVGGKYGFILASSISDYLRTPKQPIDKVVSWVLADDFGKKETRWNALRTLGYDADAVQGKIDELYGKKKETAKEGPQRVYELMKPYIGSKTAHSDFIKKYNEFIDTYNKKNGSSHSKIGADNAWCAMFVNLMFYLAGYLDLIDYGKRSVNLMETAKKKGTWKAGSDDIRFGDVVIFHDGKGEPNHTEFAIDDKYDISGNYNGGVGKRTRAGRKILGRIRPKYPKVSKEGDSTNKIRMYAPRFWENDPDYFGDETIFIDGKEGAVFDTGMYGSLAVNKVKALGLDAITIVITHPHGDHTGNVKTMVDKLPVKHVYLPDQTGIRKYQKSYAERMDSIADHCKKKGVPVTWLKMGDSFTVGSLRIQCLFQADADKLKEKDGHHFINNMSMVYKVFAGSWRILIGGDLSAEGIVQMMASGVDFSCDGFKFFWHGDRGAIKTVFVQALKGVFFAFTQYEHNERKDNGRASTFNLLRDIGAFVARAYEDGEINVDFHGATAKLTTSLGITRTFVKKQSAYKVSLTTKVKADKGSGLLTIEPEDYTAKEVQALKSAGYTVLAYLSVGSVDERRNYYKQLEPYTLRRLDDWEHERYLDVCEPAVQDWLINRGMALLNAGYDGIWADNIDVFEEYPSDSAYKGITRILQALYPHGYIMINGGMEYMLRAISQKARVAHGVTQEEVFSLITDYSGSGAFGAQIASESLEYQKYIAKALGAGMEAYLLEYTKDANLKKKIVNYCEASGAGYYISEDVDL
jgi:beta-lactamase superfamily II metal-dependent hydrolase/GH25 family lysozyme M1 (1,4-beta-N-acetylmuramidase)/endo-alpha-1,4-polygalactosaminidase (GH114 family)